MTILVPIIGVLILGVIVLAVLGMVLSLQFKIAKLISDMHMDMDFLRDDIVRRHGKSDVISHSLSLLSKTLFSVRDKVVHMSISIKDLNSIIDDLAAIRDRTQAVVESSIGKLDALADVIDTMVFSGAKGYATTIRSISSDLRGTIPDPEDTGVEDNRDDEKDESKYEEDRKRYDEGGEIRYE